MFISYLSTCFGGRNFTLVYENLFTFKVAHFLALSGVSLTFIIISLLGSLSISEDAEVEALAKWSSMELLNEENAEGPSTTSSRNKNGNVTIYLHSCDYDFLVPNLLQF